MHPSGLEINDLPKLAVAEVLNNLINIFKDY